MYSALQLHDIRSLPSQAASTPIEPGQASKVMLPMQKLAPGTASHAITRGLLRQQHDDPAWCKDIAKAAPAAWPACTELAPHRKCDAPRASKAQAAACLVVAVNGRQDTTTGASPASAGQHDAAHIRGAARLLSCLSLHVALCSCMQAACSHTKARCPCPGRCLHVGWHRSLHPQAQQPIAFPHKMVHSIV